MSPTLTAVFVEFSTTRGSKFCGGVYGSMHGSASIGVKSTFMHRIEISPHISKPFSVVTQRVTRFLNVIQPVTSDKYIAAYMCQLIHAIHTVSGNDEDVSAVLRR